MLDEREVSSPFFGQISTVQVKRIGGTTRSLDKILGGDAKEVSKTHYLPFSPSVESRNSSHKSFLLICHASPKKHGFLFPMTWLLPKLKEARFMNALDLQQVRRFIAHSEFFEDNPASQFYPFGDAIQPCLCVVHLINFSAFRTYSLS